MNMKEAWLNSEWKWEKGRSRGERGVVFHFSSTNHQRRPTTGLPVGQDCWSGSLCTHTHTDTVWIGPLPPFAKSDSAADGENSTRNTNELNQWVRPLCMYLKTAHFLCAYEWRHELKCLQRQHTPGRCTFLLEEEGVNHTWLCILKLMEVVKTDPHTIDNCISVIRSKNPGRLLKRGCAKISSDKLARRTSYYTNKPFTAKVNLTAKAKRHKIEVTLRFFLIFCIINTLHNLQSFRQPLHHWWAS